MSELAVFDFQDQAVRILKRDGEPWFVAADVCRVLEIANSRDAVNGLEEDEKATVGNPDTRPGMPGAKVFTLISESGLYSLVFKSRKPQARLFRRWVTGAVLPAIRRTGGYAARDLVAAAAERRMEAREAAAVEVEELRSMADYALGESLGGRMRLSQGRVVASLLGHRLTLLRLRLELWEPEGEELDAAPDAPGGKEAA